VHFNGRWLTERRAEDQLPHSSCLLSNTQHTAAGQFSDIFVVFSVPNLKLAFYLTLSLFLIQSQFGGGPGEKGTFDTNGEFSNPGEGLQAGGPV
jgi:hypothetical protein